MEVTIDEIKEETQLKPMNAEIVIKSKEGIDIPPFDVNLASTITFNDDFIVQLQRKKEFQNFVWKEAEIWSKTTVVPDECKKNRANCYIVLLFAYKKELDPLFVFNSIKFIKGNLFPGARLVTELLYRSKKFRNIKIVYINEDTFTNAANIEKALKYGCYVKALDVKKNTEIVGPTITLQMAKDAGWLDKDRSLWKSIPALMLQHRALAWFVNSYVPTLADGLYTAEEGYDIHS